MKPFEKSVSIRRRLQVSVTLAVAVLFAFGALGVYGFVRVTENREFFAKLKSRIERHVDETEMDVEGVVDAAFHDLTLAQFEARGGDEASEDDDKVEEGEDLEGEEDEDEDGEEDAEVGGPLYVLRDHGGEMIFQSPFLAGEHRLPFEPQSEDGKVVFGTIESPERRRLRTASISFQLPLEVLDPEEIGVVDDSATKGYDPAAARNRVHLVIAESDAEIREMLGVLAGALGGTGLLITVVTAFMIFRLINRAFQPIAQLSEQTASIDTEHLESRLPESNLPSELIPLVHQFNDLLERVQRAFDRERRFSADIAHELRTPVAEIRSLAEVALTPSINSLEKPEDPQEIYRETAAIGERMNRLINVLSDLHRTGSVSEGCRPQKISLITVLQEAAAAAADGAREQGVAIELEDGAGDDADSFIETDPALLRGILDNLLGNAVTYSNGGRPVVCSVSGDNGTTAVEIRNSTNQLKADDLTHLHEPFWQKDAARSDAAHFGLGLSTVAAYAKLLQIAVDYRLDDGEFIARLQIPTLS